MSTIDSVVRANLALLLEELRRQPAVAATYDEAELSYEDAMAALEEYVHVAHEYAVAYEVIVCTLEKHPFVLPGAAAVRLLEVGLLVGFKTEREEDRLFDTRPA